MKPHEVHENIDDIRARNVRVEADKAWETSWTRRVIIMVGTYIFAFLYLNYLGVADAWQHAFVPPVAYLISTLSLAGLKQAWIRSIYR